MTGWGVTFGRTVLAQLYERDRESADRIRDNALIWEDQVIHIRGTQVSTPYGGSYNISRQRLLDILSDRAQELGVEIEYGCEIQSRSDLPAADLVVAADGVSSHLREDAGVISTQDTLGLNKYIWLGSDKVFKDFSFFFVPTPGGWLWAHAYAIAPDTSTFVVECTQETWSNLGFDVLSTSDSLQLLAEFFREHLTGHQLFGDLGDGTSARWLNFRTISNQHWHSGNVVLIGDSAHTAHFSIGMGTTLAFEDAMALADSLQQHSDMEMALQSYEKRRQAELVPVLIDADSSARWFENISRYINLKPRRFGALFHARRSPVVAVLPPTLSYLLLVVSSRISFLDVVRARAAAAAEGIFGRRNLARAETPSIRRQH